MNLTRVQTKAAKARKEWQRLQEQKIKKEDRGKMLNLKKIKESIKEDALRDTA